MKKGFLGPGVIFLASAITFLFNFLKLPIPTYQIIVAIFIGVVVYLYSRFLTKPTQELPKYVLLFSTSLVVQLLVISSGGLLSPFLILYHIYALGLSFFSLSASLTFLILTLIDLVAFIYTNTIQIALINQDPGTVLLYAVSLLAVIPFSRLLATKYHLKVELAEVLSNKVKLGDAILESLDEMVIVTDKTLNVISLNGAVERTLFASKSEMLRKPLFDVLFLRDQNGVLVNANTISADKLNASPVVMENIYLYSKNSAFPKKIILRVGATMNLDKTVDQLTFIISDAEAPSKTPSSQINLESVRIRLQALIENLKNQVVLRGLKNEQGTVELISRISQDITTVSELENHLYQIRPGVVDIAQMAEKSVVASTEFASSMNVKVQFDLANFDMSKINSLIPQGFNISPKDLTAPYFTGSIDIKWFDYMLQKLIDIAILLTSGSNGGVVKLTIEELSKTELLIKLHIGYPSLTDKQKTDIFTPFYGELSSTNLKLGSGLEGYIANRLADILKLALSVEQDQGVYFKLIINRVPQA